MASIFDEDRKKLGITTKGSASSKGTGSIFDDDRRSLGLLPGGEKNNSQPPVSSTPEPSVIGTPMAQLQQQFGFETPLNLINSSIQMAQQQQMMNQKKAHQETKPKTQYEINQEEIDKLSPYNPVKYYSSAMNWLTQGNPVGQFISRVGSTPDTIMSGGNHVTVRPDLGPTANKVADIIGTGLTIAVPTGAPVGAGPIAAPYNAVDNVIAASPRIQRAESAIANTLSKAPMVNPRMAQAVTREVLREGAAGALQGPALAATSGQPTNRELAENAAMGSLVGGALGGVGGAAGSVIKSTLNNRTVGNALERSIQNTELPLNTTDRIVTEAAISPGQQVDNYFNELMRTSGPTTARITSMNKILTDIKPVVIERMTPPLENPRELAKWIQTNMGSDIPLNEIRKMDYVQMSNLANEIKNSMSLPQVANQVAKEMGYNLDNALRPPTRNISRDALQRGRDAQRMREIVGLNPIVRRPTILSQPERFTSSMSDLKTSTPEITAPVSEVNTVQRAAAATPGTSGSVERGFISTLRNSENTSREVAEQLDSRYTPITNAETVQKANQKIERMGVDGAEAQLLNKKKYTAEDVATGMRLIQELQSNGNVQRAVTIADRLATELTKAGQTVQAASIWNRLSPEGALLAAQRKVQRINENLLRGQTPVKITENQANAITEAAQNIQNAGLSQERAGTVSEIMSRVRNGENISAAERQEVLDFIEDAKKFLKPTKQKSPKPPAVPKEMKDNRVRDRVVSFLDDQEQAALQRIRERRGQMNSLPLDEWADYAIVGAAKLSKGVIKFADWSEQMVRDLGEGIRPYLGEIYEKSKEFQTQSVKKINEQVISRAERIATGYIKRNEAKLSESDINFVQNLARRVSELSGQEQRLASQDLQAVLQGFEKVGIGRKLQSAQYIAMLLNPLTQIRNVVGNELLYRLERLQRVVATPIDIAASKLTGGPRTITFKRGPSVWEDFFQPTKNFVSALGEGSRSGWRGVNPEGLTSKYEIQGQTFRSKYNPLTYMEKSLGAVLQGFDYAAYQRAANQRISEMAYLDAINKGIKGNEAIRQHMQTVMTNIDDTMYSIAKDYGKFVTFQNDSAFARAIMGFRRGANKITTGSQHFGLGSVVVPFAKTPANLLLRGLDYSPAGVLKAMKQMNDVLRNPATDLTRADVIESVSRALFGTGIGIMAYWLADKGAIWGKSDKDPEVRKLMQSAGIKDFQVNGSAVMRMLQAALSGEDIDEAAKLQAGDTLWAYEWAQPISMPVAIGSNVYSGVKEDKGIAKTTSDAAFAAFNTLLDSSVLSSIREIFSIPMNSENPFKDVAMNLARQVPGQFVPSMLRQLNTISDDTVRETYAMKNDVLGQITNSTEASIPWLAQQLPQRVNTLGEPQTRLNTFLDVYISPAQRSQFKPTPEAQMVIDLINETGDNTIAPRAVAKFISGTDKATGEQVRIDLTPEQYVELQTIVGQYTAEGLKKINPEWSTEKKVTRILKILDQAGKKGRNEFKKRLGLKVSK